MTKFKGIQDGTPTGEPLCRTCRYHVYIRGKAESQELRFCNAIGDWQSSPLEFEAYSCTKYDDTRLPSKNDLYQTAWILESDKTTKRIGFVSPKDKRHGELRDKEGLY